MSGADLLRSTADVYVCVCARLSLLSHEYDCEYGMSVSHRRIFVLHCPQEETQSSLLHQRRLWIVRCQVGGCTSRVEKLDAG